MSHKCISEVTVRSSIISSSNASTKCPLRDAGHFLRIPVMFSLFRFTITMCVTFAVVKGFCNSHPRWWPNRQQNLAKGKDALGFLGRMQRDHVSMKESSSSTDITSSPIAKGLQSGNISAFLDFDGESNSISDTHRVCESTCTGRFPQQHIEVLLRPLDDNGRFCNHPCQRKLYIDDVLTRSDHRIFH